MAKKTFKIKDTLAQALGDTVSSANNNAGELHVEIIPLRKVELDPDNPRDLAISLIEAVNGIDKDDPAYDRKNTEKESLSSLVHSIKEQGIINPIVVYKHQDKYRLIAGERRTLGSLLAGKEDIPAKILTNKPSIMKISLLQWIENMERADLTLGERLRNLEKILEASRHDTMGPKPIHTAAELSQLIGCSHQQASCYFVLLDSSDKLKSLIQSETIKNIDKAALIARAPTHLQDNLIKVCIDGATLKEMKGVLSKGKQQTTISKSKEGRPQSRVSLGTTKNINVAKVIIESVLQNQQYSHVKEKIGEVLWGDYKSLSNAFKQLITLLEKANFEEETH